jgi:hypothetical protein
MAQLFVCSITKNPLRIRRMITSLFKILVKKGRRCVIYFVIFSIPVVTFGQATRTWTNANGNSRWNTAGNWSSGIEPVTGDNVIIPIDATITRVPNISLNSLSVSANVSLAAITSAKTLTINNTSGTTSLFVSSGNTLTLGDGTSNNAVNLTLQAFGVISNIQGNLSMSANTTLDIRTLTLNISGNLTGSGAVTMSSGELNLGGNFTNSGTFTSGTGIVNYNGSASQIVKSTTYNNLTTNNPAGVTLAGAVTVSNILTMTSGNISTGVYTLTLTNSTPSNLSYTSGIITGRLQRAVGSTGTEYLYPVGTATAYNPLKITFSSLTAGMLTAQFQPLDIGINGLPLSDAGTEIFDRQSTGYWTLTATAPMVSTNYSVKLNYSGFSGVDALARIIKRTDGGLLTLNGSHGSISGSEITRSSLDGISAVSTDLAIGKPNPRFTTQPANFSGCSASFNVAVSGKGPLTYQWQENNGSGYLNITNGGIYSGATGSTLAISGATPLMNGYLYRCVVTDALGYSSNSSGATLSVTLPVLTFGYNYSMDITLAPASGTSDLTDFPALISFSNSLLGTIVNGGHVSNSNGYDIIFTDSNGNKLDHQIESYNAATGNFVGWVRIPLLSSTATTTIRMYYGNSMVTVDPSVKSVWTSSYKGVWHLNGTDYTDATTNLNNGTNSNTTNVTGRIAGGRGFNGSNGYIQVPTNGFVPNNNNQTISIWANYPATPGGNANLISFQAGQSGSAIQLGFRGGRAVAWEWGGTILADGGVAPSTNTWHYYVYTYDGTTSQFYVDGVFRGSSTVAPQTLLPTEGNIGRYNNGEYLNASLDEPRFSMSPKSAGWIQTEYANQNNPAGFISLGVEVNSTLLTSLGICSTTYLLNQGFPAGGTYSGTGVSGTNFNASVAGVGTHSITYFYTDATGCSNSAVKNITVTPLPGAPPAPAKQCCILNILDLEATGNNLRWYSDAGLTTLVGTGTPFATGRTTAGIYSYYVTQTINGCESQATTVTLTILSGITITSQPLPTSICTTGSGSFSITATGYNLTYRWQEAGVNITDGGIFSGATTPTLTITNPGIAKNGLTYRCVVTSSCGVSPSNSNGAVLTVKSLPVATFSYTGTPYCPNAANPSPTFSGGGTAGSFSSTAGLVFVSTATGQVNIAASTPGSYTVTNTIAAAGGCGIVTATSPIVIRNDQVWTGAISNDWNVAGNWSCGILPGINTTVQIPNVTNKPVLGAGATGSVKDLTIDLGSSLTISGNTMMISGVITNNGTLTASAGTIELNGSASQSISANTFSGNTIRNLIINNSAGVSLGGSLNITGIVTPLIGDLSTGPNYLTLISDASGTALISGSGAGTVIGNVTMQRYLSSGYGYKYFSSPFQAATVNEFGDDMNLAASFTTFYRYDENRTVSGLPASPWVNYKTTTNLLTPLAGYAVNFGTNPAANTVDVSGNVNNGPLSVTLYNNNQIYTKGFNLIGNPYPSPIDWNMPGWIKVNIDNALYYFKASTTDQYGGTYSSYINGTSSDGQATNVIPSMQGFFVHVSNGTYPVTGTLSLNNSVRITDLTHSFMKSKGESLKSLLRITAAYSSDTASYDPLVVYLDEKATTGFDNQQDALKLANTDSKYPTFYTLSNDGSRLSINGLPFPGSSLGTVPLGIKTGKNGEIIFRMRYSEGEFNSQSIYLFDAISGVSQLLGKGTEYKVLLNAGDYSNRFFLNFSNITTGFKKEISNSELINIYSSHGIIKAEIKLNADEVGDLYVYNLTGQIFLNRKIYESGYYEFSPGIKEGIYIVNFISGTRRISKKIYIQDL